MINKIQYFILICMFVLVLLLIIHIGKVIKRPVYEIVCLLIGIGLFAQVLFLGTVVFDLEGNIYDSMDWKNGIYKKETYYTENGDAFLIQGDYLIDKNNPGITYEIEDCYLNMEGYLIFDEQGRYKSTSNEDIFISEEQIHVYPLSSCSWDIWGNFNAPEPKGIYAGGMYFAPCTILMADEDISIYPGIINFLMGIFEVIPIVSLLVIVIILLIEAIKAIKNKTNVKDDVQYRLFEYLSLILILFLGQAVIGNSKSFTNLLIKWCLCLAMGYAVLSFLQGDAEMEFIKQNKADYPNGVFLRDMLQNADKEEVTRWRHRFVKWSCVQLIVLIGISLLNGILSVNL